MAEEKNIQDAEASEDAGASAEKTGSSFLDRLGDKAMGSTAESQHRESPVVAPDDEAK